MLAITKTYKSSGSPWEYPAKPLNGSNLIMALVFVVSTLRIDEIIVNIPNATRARCKKSIGLS
jgi:hypothetical protein